MYICNATSIQVKKSTSFYYSFLQNSLVGIFRFFLSIGVATLHDKAILYINFIKKNKKING